MEYISQAVQLWLMWRKIIDSQLEKNDFFTLKELHLGQEGGDSNQQKLEPLPKVLNMSGFPAFSNPCMHEAPLQELP